jgi:hypothetical protein
MARATCSMRELEGALTRGKLGKSLARSYKYQGKNPEFQ